MLRHTTTRVSKLSIIINTNIIFLFLYLFRHNQEEEEEEESRTKLARRRRLGDDDRKWACRSRRTLSLVKLCVK